MLKQLRSIKFSRVLKEPVLLFTTSRYLAYGLLLLRGILLAKYLGPYLFGVWGFITLAQQYLSYTNLGIQFAVTVDLATASSDNVGYKQKVIGNAITLSFLFAAGLAFLGLMLSGSNLNLFEQYSFNQYALLLMIWVGLFNLQQVLINIYRVYDRLIRIAICEIIFAIIPLLVTLVYRDEALITASLIAMIVSCLSNILILFYTPPFRYTFSFLSDIAWKLIKIGVPLLVYHVSFNMITLAGRTILGIFYPNEVMGYYTLANTITNGTLLGFKAVLWIFFPLVLFKTRSEVADDAALKIIQKVNNLFNTSVLLLVASTKRLLIASSPE